MVLSANILPIIAWHALFLVSFSSMGPAVAPGGSSDTGHQGTLLLTPLF